MYARSTFTPSGFELKDSVTESTGALPVGYARMHKDFTGDAVGASITLFTSAFDPVLGRGTYIAMECFAGSLAGRTGSFAFLHSASTAGGDRFNEYGLIVPDSGAGELAGISGRAVLHVEADGTHRMDFEYELQD